MFKFFELGMMPLANGFTASTSATEPRFPLDVYLCKSCLLVQLSDIVDKEILFRHYLYSSSQSNIMKMHFRDLAKEIASNYLADGELVLEIASNDGVFLREVKALGLKCLGIEPAKNLAKVAEAQGIETIREFFDESLAKKVLSEKGRSKVIIANNVVGHVDDLHAFIRGIDHLLAEDGVFIFEVPYLVDLLNKMEFDTIYHEHLSYFSIKPLMVLFSQFNMEISDVKRLNIHGGSIRVYARKSSGGKYPTSEKVNELVKLEEQMQLYDIATYRKFVEKCATIRSNLRDYLSILKKQGKTIAGYGAPAKGTVLLNFCKIGTEYLDYVIDSTPMKQGLQVPGVSVPILPPDELKRRTPDYVLILAWNYAAEILEKEKELCAKGVKFIVPLPSITVH